MTSLTQSSILIPVMRVVYPNAGGGGTGVDSRCMIHLRKKAEAVLSRPIEITSCARLRTCMSLMMPVSYLGLTPGILGAAGSIGTQG